LTQAPAGGQPAQNYADYLALDELLSLQRPRANHSDELLFIVVHQASELWFKVLLHELELLTQHLQNYDAAAALACNA
jgi:tryptophan 2,3-dioxygenase